MIKYPVQCEHGHVHDAWFQNSEAFEKLKAAGLLACERCGSTNVRKGITAPRIAKTVGDGPSATAESSEMPQEIALSVFQRFDRQFEDVGERFADEVRAIGRGEAENRPVKGKADQQEVRQLLDEGFPVLPCPKPVEH